MNYEELINEAYSLNLKVKELNLLGNKGRIKDEKIAIRKDIPTLKEKSCILAEELGHFYTTSGDILAQCITENKKQEYRARLWAYDRQVGLRGIIKAFEANCHNKYEMAEYLDVDEKFLDEAITCYSSKYGEITVFENYIIYFIPNLGVMKMF